MSKRLWSFMLSELRIVRIICKNKPKDPASGKDRECGVVTELPADQLSAKFGGDPAYCPHCRLWLCQGAPSRNGQNALTFLAYAIAEAQKPDAKFDVEFVLPDPSA